jgi:hypothetical protein
MVRMPSRLSFQRFSNSASVSNGKPAFSLCLCCQRIARNRLRSCRFADIFSRRARASRRRRALSVLGFPRPPSVIRTRRNVSPQRNLPHAVVGPEDKPPCSEHRQCPATASRLQGPLWVLVLAPQTTDLKELPFWDAFRDQLLARLGFRGRPQLRTVSPSQSSAPRPLFLPSATFGFVDWSKHWRRHDVLVLVQPLRRSVMLQALRLVDYAQRHLLWSIIGQWLRLHGPTSCSTRRAACDCSGIGGERLF